MTRKGQIFVLPILAVIAPITAAWAQDASTASEKSAEFSARYITTAKELSDVLRYNAFDFKTETFQGKEVFVVDVDGITTVVQFYGDDPEFESLQLYAGFTGDSSITEKRMNEWNSTHRFTRAYIDDEGDPVLEMDLNFTFGGISERQLEDSLALWELSVVAFRKFIYHDGKTDNDAKTFIKKLRER